MNIDTNVPKDLLSEPVTFGIEPYISEAYAQAEGDKLWSKVWQHACRVEEIPNVGDFVTYEIHDDSILIVRTAPDKISAYHNVCMHRGRRLVSTPRGNHDACGHAKHFVCGFHGFRWDVNGENIYVVDKQDWNGALTPERLRLRQVQVDTWGGWVWINMDPNCKPLRDYIEPAASMLAPFELEKMRYRWRKWCYADCNWKVAMEAFNESYHVEGTHPQFLKFAEYHTWSEAHEWCSHHGFDERDKELDMPESNTIIRVGKGTDPRRILYEMMEETYRTVNGSTTQTFVDASAPLADELPEGTPADKVMAHFLDSARRIDAERGVAWPEISPEHMAKAGIAWNIFPNMSIAHGQTFALCYRMRPAGHDPEKCIFEAFVIERFPEGGEPKTEWEYAEPTVENWRSVLMQDFDNMAEVQKGMKSRGFPGPLLNPKQERPVSNLHRNLAKFMGTGGPMPLK